MELTSSLPDANIVFAEVEDIGYVHYGTLLRPNASKFARRFFGRIYGLILHAGLADTFIHTQFLRVVLALGYPIDQTRGKALAQITIIAKKIKKS
jgi:hypothetical protein